jgi:hypothetical protein
MEAAARTVSLSSVVALPACTVVNSMILVLSL